MKKLGVLLIAAMLMVSCATMDEKVQRMNEEVTAQQNDLTPKQWESRISSFMQLYSQYLDKAVEVLSQETVPEKELKELQTLQNTFSETYFIFEKHRQAYSSELTEDLNKFSELYKKGSALITVGVTAKSAKPL